MNLIDDQWIPVVTVDGPRTIRPDEIAEPGVLRPNWPRPDLNLACYEFLVGLVYLADPSVSLSDWRERLKVQDIATRLRQRLAPFSGFFELYGDGPRFMQDLARLDGQVLSPDVLFIDSAAGQTAKNNADIMVRRRRYAELEAPLAAMAIYALQSFAPSGGAGNRVSMRGGGPLVTLVKPEKMLTKSPLWDMVWVNTPCGTPTSPSEAKAVLPWLRHTRESSGKGSETRPPDSDSPSVECFFGMPRRLRLVEDSEGSLTGVIQRPYGTNYVDWKHPLTPYYRKKPADPPLPMHPQPGGFGYRNWIGPVLQDPDGLRQPAKMVLESDKRVEAADLLIGGWDMDNMKPRDFLLSRQPRVRLDMEASDKLHGMIEAAELADRSLGRALKEIIGTEESKGTRIGALREGFFIKTQNAFEAYVRRLEMEDAVDKIGWEWLKEMQRTACEIVNREARSGIEMLRLENVEKRLKARRDVQNAFAGRTDLGRKMYAALELPNPQKDKPEKETNK